MTRPLDRIRLSRSVFIMLVLTLSAMNVLPAANANHKNDTSLTLETDKSLYYEGDLIQITGNVTDPEEENGLGHFYGLSVILTWYDYEGNESYSKQVEIFRNGSFYYSQKATELGTNKIIAKYTAHQNDLVAEKEFSVWKSPWKSYRVSLGSKNYELRYQSSEPLIIKADKDLPILQVQIDSNGNGRLVFELPRMLIDAKGANNTDSKFSVLLDEILQVPDKNLRHAKNDTTSRTLEITYNFNERFSDGFIPLTNTNLDTHQFLIIGNKTGGKASPIAIDVSTDKESYRFNKDLVMITGNVSAPSDTHPVNISVFLKKGNTTSIMATEHVFLSSYGGFRLNLKPDESGNESDLARGEYVVVANYLGAKAETAFSVVSLANPPINSPTHEDAKNMQKSEFSLRSTSRVLDHTGKEIARGNDDRMFVDKGNEIVILSSIAKIDQDVKELPSAITFLVEVNNKMNQTVFVSWINGKANSTEPFRIAFLPEEAGEYSILIFIWTTIESPLAVGDKEALLLTVNSPDISQ